MYPTRQLVESAAHTTPGSKSVLMDIETVTKMVIRFQVELNALAKFTHAHTLQKEKREGYEGWCFLRIPRSSKKT